MSNPSRTQIVTQRDNLLFRKDHKRLLNTFAVRRTFRCGISLNKTFELDWDFAAISTWDSIQAGNDNDEFTDVDGCRASFRRNFN